MRKKRVDGSLHECLLIFAVFADGGLYAVSEVAANVCGAERFEEFRDELEDIISMAGMTTGVAHRQKMMKFSQKQKDLHSKKFFKSFIREQSKTMVEAFLSSIQSTAKSRVFQHN